MTEQTNNYRLPIVEEDIVSKVCQKVLVTDRYELRIIQDMKEDNFQLGMGIMNRVNAYSNDLEKGIIKLIAAISYDFLNQQAIKEGTKLPTVTENTILKYNQQLQNERTSPKDSFEKIFEENRDFALGISNGIMAGTKDIPTQNSCIGIAVYIHDNLRNQARYDEFSKLEWKVAE